MPFRLNAPHLTPTTPRFTDDAPAPTAEELKEMVRRYAAAHFPGAWRSAAVVIDAAGGRSEVLLTLPATA